MAVGVRRFTPSRVSRRFGAFAVLTLRAIGKSRRGEWTGPGSRCPLRPGGPNEVAIRPNPLATDGSSQCGSKEFQTTLGQIRAPRTAKVIQILRLLTRTVCRCLIGPFE